MYSCKHNQLGTVLFVLVSLTLAFNCSTTAAADLNPKELASIRWIIQQYQIGWNLTGTTCQQISPGAISLTCLVDKAKNEESITRISINNLPVVNQGNPDPNLVSLIFPNVTYFSLNNLVRVNKSFHILSLVDNPENSKWASIGLSSQLADPIVIPDTFPIYLKLTAFQMSAVRFASNVPQSLFSTPTLINFSLLNIDFTSPNFTIMFDTTLVYPKMKSIQIAFNNPPAYTKFVYDDYHFPSLSMVQYNSLYPYNVTIDHSNVTDIQFSAIKLYNANSTFVTLARAPAAKSMGMYFVTFTSNITHLSVLDTVRLSNTNEIVAAKNLMLVQYAGPTFTRFPYPNILSNFGSKV
ncbi:hypothetical protein SAMD00019534_038940 [Acytostelium subglobosum LB1]|uniref:hypothetical protein n=1 Tax=Acytostelium subglobosum LB1 TaxID=1410327 RepID=UPI000644E737|nr:hypothetical protein SAMD00019534_038940 [Acytostelium subglobosum LB1]GAM20719.1 hypothetical protein SAMD00019534_038940 [Acytostelium subglobosum LB1]|eukprot:XP_012755853.1 hypothetical protein SAMD00019534_038940 [Acytostelium subglobosum LB1]